MMRVSLQLHLNVVRIKAYIWQFGYIYQSLLAFRKLTKKTNMNVT